MALLSILGGITALFFLILIVKNVFFRSTKLCVICAAVSITWMVLVALYWLGVFQDKVIIAILIGQSILGIFYVAEKRVREQFTLFRLPFLLTLTALGYSLLSPAGRTWEIALFVVLAWVLFFIFYTCKTNKTISIMVQKIVECCKRW